MRKAQKQEIMEMIQTLYEAHDEIKNDIDKKNYVLAQDMLIQCQECAITLGTAIETMEGEGFVTVSHVEAYCDVVFHCHEELNGGDISANKIYKKLKKQLVCIENSVRNDIRIRKEVAFFPYKASMWDALESVYLAAKEDPDCDAYCVPIPYYDKNPDGSLGVMHYEGGEYPKNIDITDWQAYNFEERKPDAIYIHNPYDNWNLVTCVPSRYYSNNLKKYTEQLVYIPYFILGEIEPDDQERIDKMKHFVWTPGVINADKVIVQSEKMKQIYVNEYLKAAKENGLQGYHIDRKRLEEKFLGLGSPKLDKVLNTKKEDLEIPQEWLRIIEKPDGSWKKIVFYNTSIAALLQNNEKMLEKMQYVFNVFKENQDEVALLWRPHPLIKTTVSAMRPQLWIEYDKLVRKYREEGWGIYDDSSNVDRAIVLSDVYYGDGSSVANLYNHIGKPVVMQSMKTYRNSIQNLMEWSVKYNDKLYFSAMEFNGICSIDLKNGLMNIETHIEEDQRCIFRAYGRGKKNNNKLYLVPLMSDKIVIYDLKNANYDWIALPEMNEETLKHQKSKQMILHENEIYILPQTEYYPYIVQINEDTKQTKMYTIAEYCKNSKNSFCNIAIGLNNEKFLFCLHGSLYEFLYATGEIRRSKYFSNEKIKDIYVCEDEIIILENKIVVYDYDGNIIDEIGFDQYHIPENEKINKIYKGEKSLYLYSNYSTEAKQVYCIDIQTKELKCTNIKEEEAYYISLVVNMNEFFFAYFLNDKVHIIHENLSVSEYKVNVQFNVEQYILNEKDWIQKFDTTYNCLNEADLLVKSLYNL